MLELAGMMGMPRATRRAIRAATNLLTATPEEAALAIAAALGGSPADLLRLAVACRRFATKCIAAPPRRFLFAAAAIQEQEMWSIVDEAARLWIANCTEQERGWVPRCGRQSWLGLMWEVQALRRRGAVLSRSQQSITLSEGGSRATKEAVANLTTQWAASTAVMRAGRHFAHFTPGSRGVMLGVCARDMIGTLTESDSICSWVDGCMDSMTAGQKFCLYNVFSGVCLEATSGDDLLDWEGMQGAEEGDRIGLLLDLNQGSMTVYKNDERLGVMATGLSGEYCWTVSMYLPGSSVRIEPAALPGWNLP